MKARLVVAFLIAIVAPLLMGQTYNQSQGRSWMLALTVSGNTGAHGATTVFTAPATGTYVVYYTLRTTVSSTAGTINAVTFAWNNGNAMSRNSLLVGPQVLDLSSLTSTGLTSAEITGQQPMFVTSGTAVTWATTVGVTIIGSPQYTAEFRVQAMN